VGPACGGGPEGLVAGGAERGPLVEVGAQRDVHLDAAGAADAVAAFGFGDLAVAADLGAEAEAAHAFGRGVVGLAAQDADGRAAGELERGRARGGGAALVGPFEAQFEVEGRLGGPPQGDDLVGG
jgi:hypothetical protein